MRARINHILEQWALVEPALFRVMCLHVLVENGSMPCALRTGRRTLEYNPAFIREMSDQALDQALRVEAVRILLRHPYQRRPDGCSGQAMALGSTLVVGDNYTLACFNIERPEEWDLPGGREYEWYSRRIQELLPESEQGAPGGEDDRSELLRERSAADTALSELWEEDELTLTLIDGVIAGTDNWGSLEGHMAEKLKASVGARINWKNILSGFRASILSSKRRLTRMRPNRRTDFEAMGSIRRFDTRLLVAVDVSGSISSQDLSYFYGVINSAFRYGFTAVDTIQFDAGVRVVQSLKKTLRDVDIVGRGGTSFEEPILYAHEKGYDGLVILTDGYAPEPLIPKGMRCKIAWVCNSQASYRKHERWMRKSGRVCVMELV